MDHPSKSLEQLEPDHADLRQRLDEAEEALRAIRSGEVEAFVIETEQGDHVYTLQDSDHAYRVMVETMNEGAATVMEDGVILYCNQRLANMLAVPLEQMLGASFYQYFNTEEKQQFGQLLSQAVSSQARTEMNLIVQGKPTLPALISMKAIAIEGEYRTACLIITDLTEQRRSRDELEVQVAERTAELTQKIKELNEFAFIISHDLQEPLRKVEKFGTLLIQNGSGNFTETELDYIRRMQEAARRMAKMIADLLSISLLSTQARSHQAVDLNQIAREVLSALETSLKRSQGKVTVENFPLIEAEPVHMQQLFQNLISNALKFHQAGVPPVVHVSSHEALQMDLRGSRRPAIQIEFEDNGIGFDEAQVDLLFQPFRRLVNRRDYEGTGIGLAICKKIVERYGGQITARSTLGKGSTFIVSLPLKQ